MEKLTLSPLGHTWILDLDGTLLKHNGYLTDDEDSFLPGAQRFLAEIPDDDMIIFLTSREEKYREITENFLRRHNIRFHTVIYGAPFGERIIVNDMKPSGLAGAYAFNLDRDKGIDISLEISPQL